MRSRQSAPPFPRLAFQARAHELLALVALHAFRLGVAVLHPALLRRHLLRALFSRQAAFHEVLALVALHALRLGVAVLHALLLGLLRLARALLVLGERGLREECECDGSEQELHGFPPR